MLKANSPTELQLPASLYSSSVSNLFSLADCYFQHSPSSISGTQVYSNSSAPTSHFSYSSLSSLQSKSTTVSDYLTKDEEANQYSQNQNYLTQYQSMPNHHTYSEPYEYQDDESPRIAQESPRVAIKKRPKKPSTGESLAWGAAAVGILGALGAAAMIAMKSRDKK